MTLPEAFQKYIAENHLITHKEPVLLAVSGGVDSMVMLSLFIRCGYSVAVAHCNFQLRGEESDKDEALVEQEAKRYGVKLYKKRFETLAEMERTGESMEMAARRLRYTWFNELCCEHNYTSIAIAHHADDSIETFFINLLRGTGLKGLTGISAQVGRIIRPLIFASRVQITEYAAENRIPFREDSSNRSTEYLRNKIRLDLIPHIREINPNFTEIMQGNLARLTNTQLFINRCIERIRKEAVTSENGMDTIHIDRIDPALGLDFAIYELLSSGYGFKGDVVDSLCNSLANNATGRRFYSRDRVAYINRGNIVIAPIEYCSNSILKYEYCSIEELKTFDTPRHIALLDADLLQFPLTLRRRQDGDRFVPFGMKGSKKVSDFLINARLSMPEKERQEVLLSGEEIVWVVGQRIDDRYRLTSQTKNVLRITNKSHG